MDCGSRTDTCYIVCRIFHPFFLSQSLTFILCHSLPSCLPNSSSLTPPPLALPLSLFLPVSMSVCLSISTLHLSLSLSLSLQSQLKVAHNVTCRCPCNPVTMATTVAVALPHDLLKADCGLHSKLHQYVVQQLSCHACTSFML